MGKRAIRQREERHGTTERPFKFHGSIAYDKRILYLGVDLGIADIATDSDGNQHSGSQVKSLRKRSRRQRKRIQAKLPLLIRSVI